EAWETRFVRANRYLLKGELLSVFALGSDVKPVAPVLDAIPQLPKPDYPEMEALIEGAARQAALGQANQFSAPVPIRNPHVLRKRFSHAFIVVPCLLILMQPLLLLGFIKGAYQLTMSEFEKTAAQYAPLEARIENAAREKDQAQARYDSAVGVQMNLANRRKPMFAFIHLSYFFSKYAGNTVRLESISETGGVIQIRGIYTDPEDGLSLEEELNTFAADKNLRILRNKVSEQQTADGRIVLALELDVDYQELSK
ncbi:MAG: hypothetical protein AAF585_03800, partial [Verrucomicrobiota bacterium]